MIHSVILYSIIFITGAAGLIYQVTWQRYLGRLLGSDSIATAIILATFLGGLSVGYYVCGRITTRVRNHLKAYALLEGLIGLWCLNFPAFFKYVESFTQHWRFSPPFLIIVQGIFCSALLMGIPTVCMGGTIPFLTRGLSKHIEEATRVHARVYAVNTAGACAGTLIAGFYMIPAYGLPSTLTAAAFLNIGACLYFYVVGCGLQGAGYRAQVTGRRAQVAGRRSSVELDSPQPTTNNQQPTTNLTPPSILCLVAFFSGFYVMTLENVLIRIANFSLGSSSYSFSLIVSVFILSIAAGSYVIGRFKEIHSRLLFANQLFITLSLVLVYFSLDTWPYFAHLIRATFSSPGPFSFAGFYVYAFLGFVLILILPLGLMGATVPIAFHEIKRDLSTVGKYSGILFSVNTVGNLSGSLIGGIFFYYFLNNAGVFLSAVILSSLSVLLCARYLSKSYFWLSALLTVSICIFSIFTPGYNEKNFTIGTFYQRGFLPYSLDGPADFFRQWNKGRELKFYKDGPAATVAVTEHDYPPDAPNSEKSLSIVVNGKSDSSTIGDAYTIKLLAHIPALLAEKRENVMVIGLGTGVTAGELTLYPDVKTVDIAEISPFVIEALPYFSKFNHRLNDHPGVNIHMGDAFRILGRSMKKWDIIISEPSNPWVTGVDLLFTREFYQLAKAHMTESGILAQWAHTYASSFSMLGMIVNTMQQEFKYIRVFMATAGDLVITASNKDFSIRDMENAEAVFRDNEDVRNSLGSIHLNTAESVFIREIWTPSYLSDNFSDFGIQTMDHPRLHYMAGKSFFTGERISNNRLFNSASAEYTRDFLITQKNWNRPFSAEQTDNLIFSLKDKYLGYYLPMAGALRLKAYLSHPNDYPLPQDEKNAYQTALIPFITDLPENEADWEKVNLSRASFREKAAALLDHIRRFRNWIVPYPLDGLKKLLQKGIAQGADPYEKNWCSLQMVLLLSSEHADPKQIKSVMDSMAKEADGTLIVREGDQNLLAEAQGIWKKSLCQQ